MTRIGGTSYIVQQAQYLLPHYQNKIMGAYDVKHRVTRLCVSKTLHADAGQDFREIYYVSSSEPFDRIIVKKNEGEQHVSRLHFYKFSKR
jgi:hypothetical protein